MKFVSLIGSLFIRALHATLRVEHVRAENIERTSQYILAFWHAHLLLMLHSRYRRPITVLSSQSKDAEYIVRILGRYGVDSARGSSTRGGGAAMRDLLRRARAGNNIVFTPDGPRGPARIAKDGVVYTAKMSGLPIVAVAFAAKKKSSSAPGTGWSCRIRSRKCSSSTASRCTCRVTATWRNGA
jgi:lysophospholipid acyltransferase (LPLAT)-like uncharacterized protein